MGARKQKDFGTLDLFKDVKPRPIVRRFAQEAVKAATLEGKLCLAIAKALSESELSRGEVAYKMSQHLGEEVSESKLNSWTSTAKESSHRIPASRLISLCLACEDMRPLNTLLGEAHHIIIPEKYEALIKRERAKEIAEEMQREANAADSEWRAIR